MRLCAHTYVARRVNCELIGKYHWSGAFFGRVVCIIKPPGDELVGNSISVIFKRHFGRGLGQIPIFRKYLNVPRVASPCYPYFLGFFNFFPIPPRCSPPPRFYGGNKEKENVFLTNIFSPNYPL